MNEKETAIIESKELRDKLISREEVLDKVKQLFLLPRLNLMTVQQIADYYEVPAQTVHKCYQRSKKEFDLDGTTSVSPGIFNANFLHGQNVHKENTDDSTTNSLGISVVSSSQGKTTYDIDGTKLDIPNRGIRLFPRRAVLRFGMLLKGSRIASEVRTQLLNIEEKTAPETKVSDIEEEKSLIVQNLDAIAGANTEDILKAMAGYIAFKNRHIEELKKENAAVREENAAVKEDNRLLAKEALTWEERPALSKAVRILAKRSGCGYGRAWAELYDELLYKNHINLRARKSRRKKATTVVEVIKENEWPLVLQSFAAICCNYGISPSDVLHKAKLMKEE